LSTAWWSLSTASWTDDRIKSLDVSKLQLSDKAGASLARALRNNTSLIKLEMGENQFGRETCKVLAESLLINKTLKSLSFASNPLEKCQDSVFLLANALSINSGLVSLCLWQCGIGMEGGTAICDAACKNTSLIIVEIGYNNFDNYDVLRMTGKLEENRHAREVRLSLEAESEKRRDRDARERLRVKQEKEKDDQNRRWLVEQQLQWAQSRHVELERRQAEAHKEESTRRQIVKRRERRLHRKRARRAKKARRGRRNK
jgi:Ran GTPase-activating protein (RanGAP) involved in mRNA processing and transport